MVQQKRARGGLALQRHPRAHPALGVYTVSDLDHVMSHIGLQSQLQDLLFYAEFTKVLTGNIT